MEKLEKSNVLTNNRRYQTTKKNTKNTHQDSLCRLYQLLLLLSNDIVK